jgi:23S rRNA (cytidine1920-2'-O)/16S rRNA (cytidine1409-2'-O)-methyltransferase
MEERLDKLLIERKLISSRVAAEKIILKSGILVNGKLITKPGKKIPLDATIELLEEEIPWVSRGALKLVKALDYWRINIEDKTAIDLGASIGGFSEVLLSKNCTRVYCVDEGTNQLHPRIKENHKIIDLQQTHVRELTSNLIPELVDLIVIDVSFISLEKVLPFLHPFIKQNGKVIALVKPQFEAGKENVPKTGIIKDTKIHLEVVENVKKYALMSNFNYLEHIDSPELGSDGNKEFLMLLEK